MGSAPTSTILFQTPKGAHTYSAMHTENTNFKKYHAYKDSGVQWLGEIPEHWELIRLGTKFTERRTKVSDKDYKPLSVTKQGILPQLANAAKTNDGDNRKLVKKGDFVINSRSDRKGSSGIAFEDGSVSLINIVIQPQNINPTYCNYLLKGYSFVEEFYRMGHGIVADLWTTRYDEMKNIKVGIPPLPEQTAIANFLDAKTAKIDRAIAQKERLIALLKERKQVLIQNAVTKGLDPKAPIKDSGVEWIGEIPAHWDILSVGKILTNLEQGDSPIASNSSENSFVLKLSAIKSGSFFQEELKPIDIKSYKKRFQLQKGDFLLTRGNTPELVGDTCIVKNEIKDQIIFSDLIYRLSFLLKKVHYDFILHTFQSTYFRKQISSSAKGSSSSMVKVSHADIKSWITLLPPYQEQELIATHLENSTTKINHIITLQEGQMAKLREYKASLIDSAVTGKIKVD